MIPYFAVFHFISLVAKFKILHLGTVPISLVHINWPCRLQNTNYILYLITDRACSCFCSTFALLSLIFSGLFLSSITPHSHIPFFRLHSCCLTKITGNILLMRFAQTWLLLHSRDPWMTWTLRAAAPCSSLCPNCSRLNMPMWKKTRFSLNAL